MNDYGEHWQNMKMLHKEYYQQRLKGNLTQAMDIATELANESYKLAMETKQDLLKHTVNQKP